MTIIHTLTAVLSGIWGEAEEAPNCLTTYKITNIIINLAEKYLGRENVWLMRTLCTWMRQRLMMERLRPCATARSIICCNCMLIGYPPASSVVIVVVVLSSILHVLFSCKRIISTQQSFVFAFGFVYIELCSSQMLALWGDGEKTGRLFYRRIHT